MSEKFLILFIFGITYLSILYLQVLSPRVSRRDILLGVKIPRNMVEDKEIKNILKSYKKNSLFVGIILFFMFMFLNYRYIDSILILLVTIFLYMGILFFIHLYYHNQIKEIKEKSNWVELADNVRVVDLKYTKERGEGKSIFRWAFLPIIILLINILISLYMYPKLGPTIPTHWDVNGIADNYRDTSLMSLMFPNIINLSMVVLMAWSYHFINRARPNLDKENLDLSIERDRVYRKSWSSFMRLTLLGMQLIFTYINLASLEIVKDMKWMMIFSLAFTFIIIILSIYLGAKLGQGGERIKKSGEKDSKGYGLEDDEMWRLGGTIYYNEDDPALFVDKRVGVGWTINVARPMGKVSIILTILIIVFVMALGIREG